MSIKLFLVIFNFCQHIKMEWCIMKKSNLWICILLIVFAANQVHCGTADSSAEEEQIFGQGFLNPNVNQSDSAFNPDSMVGGVLPDYILKTL